MTKSAATALLPSPVDITANEQSPRQWSTRSLASEDTPFVHPKAP